MFLCSFSRFHEVRTIFSRSRCSAKHPAEWGTEGWGVSRSHPQKCHSSFRQRHFSLHRMYQLNSFWLTFAVSTWTMVLFWWMCSQAQRVPARKQQVEATRATAGKDAKTHLTYIKTQIFIFPDVRMLFLFSEEPVGLKWTPQRVPNTRHQPMSAMVCRFVLCMSADCLILLVAFLKWLPAALFRNGICRRSPLRTAWLQGCEAAKQTECHTRRWEETSRFCYMSLTRIRRKHWSGFDTFRITETLLTEDKVSSSSLSAKYKYILWCWVTIKNCTTVGNQLLRSLNLILIRTRNAEVCVVLIWHLLTGDCPEIIWWPGGGVDYKRDRKSSRETRSGPSSKKTNEFECLVIIRVISHCQKSPASRIHPIKKKKEKPAVLMGVSSRGLWEHSRSSRHHKGPLSFSFQLGKHCCESHVLSGRRTGPSRSRTVQAQHRQDSCCQQKKRQERSLDPPAVLLLLRLCTKVTVAAHTPSDATLHLHLETWVCDSLTSPVSDSIVQKSCVVSSAVAMLRKRLPPLEELRLDEEVATYTSVLAATGFLPPQPRCGNPLAAMLHFEESSVSALLTLTCAGKSQFTSKMLISTIK